MSNVLFLAESKPVYRNIKKVDADGNVYFDAERIGTVYRGLVIDSKTHRTIAITAHTYPDETVAIQAARRMHLESVPEEIQAFLPYLTLEH